MAEGAAASGPARRGRLAARRRALGLTQEQLAERLNVERTTVVRWERGQSRPLPWLRPKLAKALRVSVHRIEELLAADDATAGPERPGAVVPRQLPAAVADFTGRAAELRTLTQMVDQAAAGAPGTVVISAIGGTAGVGKTALALHWGHQFAAQFSDGQLHVNLRGFDPAGIPATPAEVIRGFLDALGVPPRQIPSAPEAQAGLYRSLLADKRMLIVLDNAREEEQVRPLLPASPGSLVLVTSRNQLSGLAATDAARLISLDVLSHAEAVQMLTARLGAARVGADSAAVEEIAGLCACLPLALAVAAARAAARPTFPLASLASELRASADRLAVLDAGDPAASVRAVFSWSTRQLTAEAARMFRLTGLHPGPDFDRYAAAALAGVTAQLATRLLEVLARAHLIETAGPGRYTMHDLLRAYARQLVTEEEGEEGRRRALTRLLDYYLHAAASAMDVILPGERYRRPHSLPTAVPGPFTDRDTARAWLDGERLNLVAVVAFAAQHGWPGHVTRVAATIYRYLDYGGHYQDGMVIHDHARHAAHQAGDHAAEAQALVYLATAVWRQGNYDQAARHAREAVLLARQAGDQTVQARALDILGTVSFHQGLNEQAAEHLEQAVALYRTAGDQGGQAGATGNLAGVFMRQGSYEQAAANLRQALALFREMGNRAAEGSALNNLGIVEELQGHYEEAASYHGQALRLFRETGYRGSEAHALNYLGIIDQRQGRYRQAIERHQQALTLFREAGDRAGECVVLNGLAEAYLAAGQFEAAHTPCAAALELASQVGKKEEQARAHDGLGRVHSACGNTALARQHWQQALTIYTELGLPQADKIRAQLAAERAVTEADTESSVTLRLH